MSRRSFLVALGLFALLACAAGTALVLLVRHEPRVYLEAEVRPGADRKKLSQDFLREFTGVLSSVRGEGDWYGHFTQEQINSYLDEGFVQSRLGGLLPDGISEPRVTIEQDQLRLAFRYGSGFWSTVISIDLNIWLPRREPNVVALKLEGFHAGALPISAQSLLERIADVLRRQDIEVTLYRLPQTGNPVALLRFQANQPRPTVRLEQLELRQGELVIGGRSNDLAALRTMLTLPLTGLTPAEGE
jgi:hypothetical protein